MVLVCHSDCQFAFSFRFLTCSCVLTCFSACCLLPFSRGRTHIPPYTILFFDAVGSRLWGHQHLPLFLLAQDDHLISDLPFSYWVLPGAELLKDDGGGANKISYGREYPAQLFVHAQLRPNSFSFDPSSSPSQETVVEVNLRFSSPTIIKREDYLAAQSRAGWPWPLSLYFSGPWPDWFVSLLRYLVNPWYIRLHAQVDEDIVTRSCFPFRLFLCGLLFRVLEWPWNLRAHVVWKELKHVIPYLQPSVEDYKRPLSL